MHSARSVPMFVGRTRRLLVPGGLVVIGCDAVWSDVEMPTIRHSLGHNTEGSPKHGAEFDGIHTGTTKMFRTTERIISKGTIQMYDFTMLCRKEAKIKIKKFGGYLPVRFRGGHLVDAILRGGGAKIAFLNFTHFCS